MDSQPPTPLAVAPARKGKWRRRFALLGIMMLVVSGCVASLPSVLSLSVFKPRVERALSAALGAPVTLRNYRLGWWRGAGLRGLEVAQPEGFRSDRPLLTVERADLRVSWLAALRLAIDVAGEVHGVRLLVLQNADGRVNVQQLGARQPAAPAHPDAPADPPRAPGKSRVEVRGSLADTLRRVRADLALRDVAIDIVHAEKGTLESIRKLDATLDKRAGTTDFDLELTAELAPAAPAQPPGRIQVRAEVDGTMTRPLVAQLTTAGFDVARYRPLVDAMLGPGQLSALAGVLDGTVQARIENLDTVFVQGALTVDRPHVAGALLQGMNVQAAKWLIQPNVKLALAGGAPRADLGGLSLDLGMLQVQGVAPEATQALFAGAPALACDFTVDLRALGACGGPLPAQLAAQPGSARGRAAVRLPPAGARIDDVVRFVVDSVQLDAQITVPDLAIGGVSRLLGVDLSTTLRQGKLALALAPGARLNGGALTLSAGLDLAQPNWPAQIDLSVQDTMLLGDAWQALQYAVPLFAGLAAQAGTTNSVVPDLGGKGSLVLTLAGPGFKGSGDSWLAWLNHWAGGGNIALTEASVRPAAAFATLLQLADPEAKGVLAFRDLATDFRLRAGGVETALMKLDVKSKKLGLRGRTSLDGTIAHTLDLSDLLRGHKDGEKVLRYLRGKAIEGALTGTLLAPQLQMPDVRALVAEALKNAAREEVQKGAENLIQKGIEELFKRKKE